MDKRFLKGAAVPATMGLCADEYHYVRAVRLAMQKDVDVVQEREKELYEHMIETLSKGDSGAAGKFYRVQRRPDSECLVPKVEDWAAVFAFVKSSDRFDLLQKRISDTAVTAMWDAGEIVPGVGKIIVPKLSVTKI